VRLARLGKISAARQALVAEPLVPGAAGILNQVRDAARRPREPREATGPILESGNPDFDSAIFLKNAQGGRSGAAGGPSGMTTVLLQCLETSSSLLANAASMLAKGSIPGVVRDILRVGRLTALSKPGGRGITTDEVIRRVVAKTLAQIYAKNIDQACSPLQYALSKGVGAECIAHTLRAA
jgi:hypothetical protein